MNSRWSGATVCVGTSSATVGELPVATQLGSTVIELVAGVACANAVIAAWRSGAVHSVKPIVWPVPSKPWPVTS